MANSGEREVVGRDHDLLTRTSIQEGSARLRALVEIQVEPAAPVGVLEGDSAVPNNVCTTEKLVRTGRDYTPHNNQLMPKHTVLNLKVQLRLE